MEYWIYLLIMAGSTYLIRAIPFALVRKKIESPFIRSFLAYVPYAVLAGMTIPEIFYSTGNSLTALAGLAVALVLAWLEKGLLTVALAACAAVYLAQWIL